MQVVCALGGLCGLVTLVGVFVLWNSIILGLLTLEPTGPQHVQNAASASPAGP